RRARRDRLTTPEWARATDVYNDRTQRVISPAPDPAAEAPAVADHFLVVLRVREFREDREPRLGDHRARVDVVVRLRGLVLPDHRAELGLGRQPRRLGLELAVGRGVVDLLVVALREPGIAVLLVRRL